jgi:hypothetical protein
MMTYTNPYAEKTFAIISPLLGPSMAKSVIRLQTSKLGLNEEKISPKDMPQIAEGIRKGLVVFLGSETAKQISDKIASIY